MLVIVVVLNSPLCQMGKKSLEMPKALILIIELIGGRINVRKALLCNSSHTSIGMEIMKTLKKMTTNRA